MWAGPPGRKKTGALGCGAHRACCPDPEVRYQGLVGERVRVVDPLGGALHVPGLARAPQRGDDLVMVPTAEQLGLTRVQGNTWGQNGKWCQKAQSLPTPLKSCHTRFFHTHQQPRTPWVTAEEGEEKGY